MGWTALIGAGLQAGLRLRIDELNDTQRWSLGAGRIQLEQLRWLLRRAADTEYGKRHRFAAIARLDGDPMLAAYRAEVPVADIDAFRPLLARMRDEAEPDVLWPGVVRNWAQTSGTTAGDKFIPVSDEMLAHNRKAGLDIFAHYARRHESLSHLFAGKLLFLGGSTDLAVNEHGVRTGDLSGVVTPMIRWPISAAHLPGRDIALMSDWTRKIEAMARVCLDADVRFISGMPSWASVLFERMISLANEQGRRVSCMRELWPGLTLFVHGGVKYAPFEPRVRSLWSGDPRGDDIPQRLEVYPASEGFIAMQDTPGDPGLRLNIDHRIFYEFVPLEEIHDPHPSAVTCDRAERGQRYVVVMSTCAGLYRYIIGDVVEFDTIPPDGPPRLRIVGRHKHFINAFGENIIVEHIENAVVEAARAVGAEIGEFTAAPVYPDATHRAGLELAVEWTPTDPQQRRVFRDAFDRAIKSQNVDYTTKRASDLGMAPPTITSLPDGALHRWMQSRGKLGGQHKAPRCANHRDIIDGVRAVAGIAETPASADAVPAGAVR
ncbi:MAG: GH3 auxin-responsive promoter family protein [Phycisphaeraceae bacterium]|nr:GH3 auxin-responsive promoter family protein [Phycisphaeraceae bacterium]